MVRIETRLGTRTDKVTLALEFGPLDLSHFTLNSFKMFLLLKSCEISFIRKRPPVIILY